uniref:UFM1-specific peptidase 1 (non-functional) n=1 Tax=Cyprinus carpio TaxID=7962 RepID=A0A8C2EEL8_CYPCA
MERGAHKKTECIDWGRHVCGQTPMTANNETWKDTLVKNAHDGLLQPSPDCDRCSMISGDCLYYHYGCDGKEDRGWGCGYRTVQTMASWLSFNQPLSVSHRHPPSLSEIQQTLVEIGDKPDAFLGSREWIGTFEASLVLDQLYDVPCRIVHVRYGKELDQAVKDLHDHFLLWISALSTISVSLLLLRNDSVGFSPLYGKKILWLRGSNIPHSSKYLLVCSAKEIITYRFGMT